MLIIWLWKLLEIICLIYVYYVGEDPTYNAVPSSIVLMLMLKKFGYHIVFVPRWFAHKGRHEKKLQ